MSDVYTSTERDAGRFQAAHAEHWSDYDGEPFDQPRGTNDPDFAQLCDRLLVEAGGKHRCDSCGGSFYERGKRDEHRARCAG